MGISRYGLNLIASTCLLGEVISKWFLDWPSGVAGHVLRGVLAAVCVPAYLRLMYLLYRQRQARRAQRSRV